MIRRILITLAIALALPADARDPAQVRAFRATHPCPATGKSAGACPGWVVDHKVPLCGGGADRPSNMQWQALAESKAKDVREVRYCACLKRHSGACSLP